MTSGGARTQRVAAEPSSAGRASPLQGRAGDHPYRSTGGFGMPERELIDPGNDKRYVRRDDQGQFKESVEVGRSLAADRRQKARTTAKKGQGDRGDQRSGQ
jgi:hypothetical protein